MTENINRMDELNVTTIFVFIFIIVLTSCVIGIWFILSTKLNNANKVAITLDEKIHKLKDIQEQTPSIYAPLSTVKHVESSLLDAIHKRTLTDNNAIDMLSQTVHVTTEEALHSCIDNISKVNAFSRDYATKSYGNTVDINSKFLDIENDIDTWQKHQEFSYSNFTAQQNKLMNAYKKNVEDVQKNEDLLINNVKTIDNNMKILKDNLEVLSQYSVKNNILLDDKLTEYYVALNRLQSTTNRYNTNFNNELTNLGQSNMTLRNDLYNAKETLTNELSTINGSVNKQLKEISSSLSDQLNKSYTSVNDSFDMYSSNIKQYITLNEINHNYVNDELTLLKKPPICRDIIGSVCKDKEYISGMTFQEVPHSKFIIRTRCCE